MALAMPPPVSPTGLGSCVKKAQLSDVAAVVNEVAKNQEQHADDAERGARR